MGEMEKALAAVSEADLQEAVKEPVQLQTRRPQPLSEQVNQLETIQRQIADRIRRAGVDARCVAENKITEAHARHARLMADETARIDRERDDTIAQATEDYHNRLHELATLLRKRA